MKLQIALDEVTIEQGLSLCEQTRVFIDIIEIGSPFIIKEGMHAVRAFRQRFPEKEILADAKIMDAGELEAMVCFEAGADVAIVGDGIVHAKDQAAEAEAEAIGAKIHG